MTEPIDISAEPVLDLVDALGSILLASSSEVDPSRVAHALEVPVGDVVAAIGELRQRVTGIGGDIQTTPSGGYRLITKPENADLVRRVRAIPKRKRLSDEALETLVMIVREGPVTLPRIGEVRGVKNLRGTIETLLDEGLVEIAGRAKARGAPRLYRATPATFDRFPQLGSELAAIDHSSLGQMKNGEVESERPTHKRFSSDTRATDGYERDR